MQDPDTKQKTQKILKMMMVIIELYLYRVEALLMIRKWKGKGG